MLIDANQKNGLELDYSFIECKECMYYQTGSEAWEFLTLTHNECLKCLFHFPNELVFIAPAIIMGMMVLTLK